MEVKDFPSARVEGWSFRTVIATTVSVISAFFQVRESETVAQLRKGSDWELPREIQFIFAIAEPRPARAAAAKAVGPT